MNMSLPPSYCLLAFISLRISWVYNLKIYVDRNLANEETFFFRIGTYTEIMSLKYSDFKRLTRPKVLDFAALA